MSKVQRTPIPLPGSKLKSKSPKAPTASSKPSLSQEFIDSSDEESNADATHPPPKKTAKPEKQKRQNALVTIGVHRPKSNGVVKKTQVPMPARPKQNPAPKAVNEELESSSSDSSESDHENVEGQEYPSRKNAGEKSADEESESESESSSETSSSESEDDTAPNPAPTASKEPKPTQSHTVEFRPVQPFVPPKGYTAVPTPLHSSSQATKSFENLGGKQVWHITAPAGVPLSQVKEIVMDKAFTGDAILTHKGTDYGFSRKENDEGIREVLIPRQNGYKTVSTRISQTLHLEQVIRLPNLSFEQADQNTGSEAAASITRSTIRAPRSQIRGLKMRYFHSGFGDRTPGTLGSSDNEDNDEDDTAATSGLSVPNGKQLLEKPKKRKHTSEVNAAERLESPTKKHKKHRTPEEIKEREEKKAKKEKKREKERSKT